MTSTIVTSRPYLENDVIFAMTSQAVQILYVGLFFDTELWNVEDKLVTS